MPPAANPTPDPKAVRTVAELAAAPEIRALRLFTLYANAYTHLCSLRHRCVVAGWEGGNAQEGIPHVNLTPALARAVGVREFGPSDDVPWEAFWGRIFDYLETHPEILGG